MTRMRKLAVVCVGTVIGKIIALALVGKTLWVVDRDPPYLISYAGRVQSIELRFPAGSRPMLVAVCLAAGGDGTLQIDRREIAITSALKRESDHVWSIMA